MHLLYRKIHEKGAVIYELVREIHLTGGTSPFPTAEMGLWHRSGDRLLFPRLQEGERPEDHAVVIDLKPKLADLNLYELTDVWGYTTLSPQDELWAPHGLRLQTIFRDGPARRCPTATRARFPLQNTREFVHEFLYIRQSHPGNWAWGRIGFVNGALLFPDQFWALTDAMRQAAQDDLEGGAD
ncbi:MAG: hypothetical protein M0Z66_12460 [Thermaerobacter sp.]|nr:hypothetical protein [Thermaerobacter sp.]